MFSEMPRRKRLLVVSGSVLLVLAIAAILLELAAYYVIVIQQMNFFLPLDLRDLGRREVQARRDSIFSRELGWELKQANPHGYRGEEKDVQNAVMAVFGDSFTYGYPEIGRSWPHLLEVSLGRPVLNFGVGGYGTDQAYLRFEARYAGRLDAPCVALMIMPENIARVVNRYRGFYTRKKEISLTKPRFYRDDSGEFRLLPNPLSSITELDRLADPAFLQQIGEHDYWYEYYERYDLNHLVHFPYSYFFVRQLPHHVRMLYRFRTENYKVHQDLYRQDSATGIMTFLAQRFIARARDLGSLPLVVFLPSWKDLVDQQREGTTVYDDLFEKLRRDHPGVVYDAMRFFAPHLDRGEPVPSFFRSENDGHYNPRGERIIGDGMLEILRSAGVPGAPEHRQPRDEP